MDLTFTVRKAPQYLIAKARDLLPGPSGIAANGLMRVSMRELDTARSMNRTCARSCRPCAARERRSTNSWLLPAGGRADPFPASKTISTLLPRCPSRLLSRVAT